MKLLHLASLDKSVGLHAAPMLRITKTKALCSRIKSDEARSCWDTCYSAVTTSTVEEGVLRTTH
jgi:hypothetical protein